MTIRCDETIRNLCDDFMSGLSPRYIFGRTPYSASISDHVLPDGIIDDYTDEKLFNGIPVIKLSNVPEDAIVVSGIIDGRPVTVSHLLSRSGLCSIDYFSFKKYSGLMLKEPPLVAPVHFRVDYDQHRDRYENIKGMLADDISIETFSRLVNFRLKEDLNEMEYFSFRPEDSYFEPFSQLAGDDLVFVDVGAFDGATTSTFIHHYPAYRNVHLFEPEPYQMNIIRGNLAGLSNIQYHEYGASNCEGSLRFNLSGSWSHIDENGEVEIKINTIDSIINEKVSFIKMDVEGHEYAALEGSRQHIIDDHPVLAICAYHRVDDFWKLPELVLSYRSDYKIYMRHYTEGLLETVYYFVPEKDA